MKGFPNKIGRIFCRSQRVGEGPLDLIAAFGSSYRSLCSAKIRGTEFIREGFSPDTLQSQTTQSATQFAARQCGVEDVADFPTGVWLVRALSAGQAALRTQGPVGI